MPNIPKIEITKENFEEFVYKPYYRMVYSYFSRYIEIIEDVKDKTQDVFVKVLVTAEKGELKHESLTAFIIKVRRNTLIDYWRKSRETVEFDDRYLPSDLGPEPSGDDDIADCLSRLTPRARSIFIMRHLDSFKPGGIAEIYGLRSGYVSNILNTTKQRLQECMESHGRKYR